MEGAALSTLAVAEIGAAVALVQRDNNVNSALVPLLGLQNLYVTGIGLDALDRQRARRRPFTPPENLGQLVSAPFRPDVLRKPGVWLGGLGVTAGAFALTLATTQRTSTRPIPNVLGVELEPVVGYPALAGLSAATFMHVAVGEEVIFRGLVQSGLARGLDPTAGWLLGTAIFGAFHVPNILNLPTESRVPYLLVSLPYITLVGGYLGLVYRWYGHSLGPPVAIHFWYDLLVSGLDAILRPNDNFFSLGVTIRL